MYIKFGIGRTEKIVHCCIWLEDFIVLNMFCRFIMILNPSLSIPRNIKCRTTRYTPGLTFIFWNTAIALDLPTFFWFLSIILQKTVTTFTERNFCCFLTSISLNLAYTGYSTGKSPIFTEFCMYKQTADNTHLNI